MAVLIFSPCEYWGVQLRHKIQNLTFDRASLLSLLFSPSHVFKRFVPLSSSSCTTFLIIFPTAIREYDAKLLLAYWLQRAPSPNPNFNISPSSELQFPAPRVAQILWDPESDAITPDSLLPSWVSTTKLVAKPDQLIKRRGKAGLLALNKDWQDAKRWILERAGKPQRVSLYITSS